MSPTTPKLRKVHIILYINEGNIYRLYRFSDSDAILFPEENFLKIDKPSLPFKFISKIKTKITNKMNKKVTFSKDSHPQSEISSTWNKLLIPKETYHHIKEAEILDESKKNSSKCNICKKGIVALDYLGKISCKSITCLSLRRVEHELQKSTTPFLLPIHSNNNSNNNRCSICSYSSPTPLCSKCSLFSFEP